MSTVRIAHFSDTHVLSLKGVRPQRFLNKRWTGAVNLALNRSRHYRTEIFIRLLEAISALKVDHALCSGDLVNLALEAEFEMVAGLLRAHFRPDQLTVVPGNHDYYVKEAIAAGLFERRFSDFLPADLDLGLDQGLDPRQANRSRRYPVTRLLDDVLIIGLSSAIPTPAFVANGQIGRDQLAGLQVALAHPEARGRFRLVMLHHPLLPEPARRLDNMRRLIDAPAAIATLRATPATRPHLVVHGHNHEFKWQSLPGTDTPLIQVASASRAGNHSPAEFNVYVITDGMLARIERHIHDPITGAFTAHDALGRPLALAS